MRQLVLKLVFPLTIVSFLLFTKWWYVLVVDGPDTIMYGFPLIYTCQGFHTSMSSQFFLLELLVDLAVYFLFWLGMVYLIHRFVWFIRIPKVITILLFVVTLLLLGFNMLFVVNPDNLFSWKRDFGVEIMKTGFKWDWQQQEHPDYYDYHPEKRKQ